MANYNKSFNFKNGVQVDNDNFVVNSAGLVGIGTSVPSEFLDVYGASHLHGHVTVSGLVTTTDLTVTGISTILGNVGIGTTNITGGAFGDNSTVLNAGIVTANYFYGNATYMTGIVGFATAGWNIVTPDGGSANQGISTTSKVGIGTTLAINKYDLIIGQDPYGLGSPSGISFDGSGGNIRASGIVTATEGFVGVGSLLTSLDVDNVGYGTISNTYLPVLNNDRLPTTIDLGSTGRITSQSFVGTGISITGIATAGGGFIGTLTGNVTGIASTARDLTSDATVKITSIDSATIVGSAASVGTSIGVGTATPVGDIHVRKSAEADIQVTSDNKTAIVAVGRSTVLNGYNGQFRFGHTTGSGKYSNKESLDIINYGPGNLNFIGNANLISGISSSKMTWGFGEASTVDLTLTQDGKFGIGTTEPVNPLHVVGISTFQTVYATTLNISDTGNVGLVTLTSGKVTASEFVSGNITKVGGTILLDTGLSGTGATDARINANSYLTVGVSTFKDIEVVPTGGSGAIGIGTTANSAYNYLSIGSTAQFNVGRDGFVGVGTTVPAVAMDFRASGAAAESRAIMLPRVTGTERTAISGGMGLNQKGTLIYNSSTNKLNFWNGSAWEAVTSS